MKHSRITKLSKAPSNMPRTSDVNLVTWRDIAGSEKSEAQERFTVEGRHALSFLCTLKLKIQRLLTIEGFRIGSDGSRFVKMKGRDSEANWPWSTRDAEPQWFPEDVKSHRNYRKVDCRLRSFKLLGNPWKVTQRLAFDTPKESQQAGKPFEITYTQTPDMILKE